MARFAFSRPRRLRYGSRTAVIVLIAINCFIEAILLASDLGFIGSPYWRGHAYDYGAFFATLLHGEPSNFALQPVSMFFTYAFLHGGSLHLLVNMFALWSVGSAIETEVGTNRFVVFYIASALGGALVYGLLSDASIPMVGASGAIFGLLGVWFCWGYLERRYYREGMREIYRGLGILIAYNAAFFILLQGNLAWETHLGGFIAGWATALIWGRPVYRRRRSG